MSDNDSGQDQEPRDQTGTAADPAPEDDDGQAGTAPGPRDKEGVNVAPGPAEEKDRKSPDDRGLTTDTSPSD